MLDRALQLTLRNFSTLFLIAALLTVPVHLIYSFIFREVIALQEVHQDIGELGRGRRVTGVGKGRVQAARWAGFIPVAVELLALPLLIRAARRVIEADHRGEVPGAIASWRNVFASPREPAGLQVPGTTIALGVLLGLLVGFLTERIGLLLISPLSPDLLWLGDGLVRGIAHATGAPFLLIPLALSTRFAKG